jgi:predicted DNA-binding protein (MmcQ/YjbR family)
MNIETFRDHCITKTGVSEEFPFDNETLVYKVGGKMFALTNIDLFESVNLKCDPMLALELRERYHAVIPGYHMNKKHWNTIKMDGSIPDSILFEWIDHSYDLVYKSLPKKIKENL